MLLIATTGFPAICMALEKLGAPKIFTVQLLMLYRYLFVLIEESIRTIRAYTLRSFSRKKLRYDIFKQLLGNLLLAHPGQGPTHPHGHAVPGFYR